MRQVKGLNLRGIVRGLAAARHSGVTWQEDEIGDAHRFFTGERVIAAAWYPLPLFLGVLDVYHRKCFAGTDDGAIRLGYLGAQVNAELAHGAGVQRGPSAMLNAFPRLWRQNFDFGALEVVEEGTYATVTFRDYDDIGRVHGLLHVGWFRALCKLSGATHATSRATATPWDHRKPLSIELHWAGWAA